VPASNFEGTSAKRISSNDTRLIMCPPPIHGGIGLEDLAPAVQDADAGRAVGLVRGPRVEVGVDRGEVDRDLRHGLRAVDEHERAGGVRAARDVLDRVDRAEHVGDVGDGDELGPLARLVVELVELQPALVVEADDVEHGAALGADHVPRDDHRVVLHLGEHDAVAGLQVRAPHACATRLIAWVALPVRIVLARVEPTNAAGAGPGAPRSAPSPRRPADRPRGAPTRCGAP
jgi:hypothetical protein